VSEYELREVDYQIAREVFGWSAEEVDAVRWCEAGSLVDCANKTRELPRYSTDIAAAWLVVEKLKMTVKPSVLQVEEARWLADVRGVCDDDRPWRGYGPTAPIAICLAALAAVAS